MFLTVKYEYVCKQGSKVSSPEAAVELYIIELDPVILRLCATNSI